MEQSIVTSGMANRSPFSRVDGNRLPSRRPHPLSASAISSSNEKSDFKTPRISNLEHESGKGLHDINLQRNRTQKQEPSKSGSDSQHDHQITETRQGSNRDNANQGNVSSSQGYVKTPEDTPDTISIRSQEVRGMVQPRADMQYSGSDSDTVSESLSVIVPLELNRRRFQSKNTQGNLEKIDASRTVSSKKTTVTNAVTSAEASRHARKKISSNPNLGINGVKGSNCLESDKLAANALTSNRPPLSGKKRKHSTTKTRKALQSAKRQVKFSLQMDSQGRNHQSKESELVEKGSDDSMDCDSDSGTSDSSPQSNSTAELETKKNSRGREAIETIANFQLSPDDKGKKGETLSTPIVQKKGYPMNTQAESEPPSDTARVESVLLTKEYMESLQSRPADNPTVLKTLMESEPPTLNKNNLVGAFIGGPQLRQTHSLDESEVTMLTGSTIYGTHKERESNDVRFVPPEGSPNKLNYLHDMTYRGLKKNTTIPTFDLPQGPKEAVRVNQSPSWRAQLRDEDIEEWSVDDGGVYLYFKIDDQIYRHDPLPPGWRLHLSESQHRPYYSHPDRGKTWDCPVVLPPKKKHFIRATQPSRNHFDNATPIWVNHQQSLPTKTPRFKPTESATKKRPRSLDATKTETIEVADSPKIHSSPGNLSDLFRLSEAYETKVTRHAKRTHRPVNKNFTQEESQLRNHHGPNHSVLERLVRDRPPLTSQSCSSPSQDYKHQPTKSQPMRAEDMSVLAHAQTKRYTSKAVHEAANPRSTVNAAALTYRFRQNNANGETLSTIGGYIPNNLSIHGKRIHGKSVNAASAMKLVGGLSTGRIGDSSPINKAFTPYVKYFRDSEPGLAATRDMQSDWESAEEDFLQDNDVSPHETSSDNHGLETSETNIIFETMKHSTESASQTNHSVKLFNRFKPRSLSEGHRSYDSHSIDGHNHDQNTTQTLSKSPKTPRTTLKARNHATSTIFPSRSAHSQSSQLSPAANGQEESTSLVAHHKDKRTLYERHCMSTEGKEKPERPEGRARLSIGQREFKSNVDGRNKENEFVVRHAARSRSNQPPVNDISGVQSLDSKSSSETPSLKDVYTQKMPKGQSADTGSSWESSLIKDVDASRMFEATSAATRSSRQSPISKGDDTPKKSEVESASTGSSWQSPFANDVETPTVCAEEHSVTGLSKQSALAKDGNGKIIQSSHIKTKTLRVPSNEAAQHRRDDQPPTSRGQDELPPESHEVNSPGLSGIFDDGSLNHSECEDDDSGGAMPSPASILHPGNKIEQSAREMSARPTRENLEKRSKSPDVGSAGANAFDSRNSVSPPTFVGIDGSSDTSFGRDIDDDSECHVLDRSARQPSQFYRASRPGYKPMGFRVLNPPLPLCVLQRPHTWPLPKRKRRKSKKTLKKSTPRRTRRRSKQ